MSIDLASRPTLFVMRGLDPRIHSSPYANDGMYRRVKPGDDIQKAGVP
jgi:hypothetical protein